MKRFIPLLIILYYFIYSYTIDLPFIILNISFNNIPLYLYNLYSISTQIIFISSIIYIYREDLKNNLNDFKINYKKYLKMGLKYWFIGLNIMIISNILISLYTSISLPENEEIVRKLFDMSPLLMSISIIFLAPLGEELIFRKTLFNLIPYKWIYILLSGLIFGGLHIIGTDSLLSILYIIPYSVLGIAFAYLYYKTRNIFPSIIMHAIHNIISIIGLIL